MANDVIPLITTHHSIGKSIITAEKEATIEKNKPVSALAIAKVHGSSHVVVVDDDISGYWKLYNGSKSLGLQLVYGLKLGVCRDMHDKTPESSKTESKIIVWLKNSQAYYDFIPMYSKASTIGMHKIRRLDWKTLQEHWTENLKLALPFYSSFIARNLLVYDQACLPDFGDIKPVFFVNNQGHPFDSIIQEGVENYCSANGHEIQKAHQIYYYRDADVMKHQTFLCMSRRATWQKPEIAHYCSNQFSYESYLRSIGKSL